MTALTRQDLFGLERYAAERPRFRARVMAHKKNRRLSLGEHATLHFEDRLTIQYQVQEMLRAERIFEREAIEEELAAYNPLIPDGRNWKATLMIELPDPVERREALRNLRGIEERVWVRVDGFERVHPIADEDLERESGGKTSAVHFLRFELTEAMAAAVKAGAAVCAGIDHPACRVEVTVPGPVRDSLAADIEGA